MELTPSPGPALSSVTVATALLPLMAGRDEAAGLSDKAANVLLRVVALVPLCLGDITGDVGAVSFTTPPPTAADAEVLRIF